MANHPNLPQHIFNATVTSINELSTLDSSVTTIIIDSGVSEPRFTELDISQFTQLKSLEIGDHCLSYVTTMNITGLSELESVVISDNSFTKKKNGAGNDSNRHFYLKNCPKLKSLKIG